jgi:multisubunit Na+/H+ antiporter MnhE subunit
MMIGPGGRTGLCTVMFGIFPGVFMDVALRAPINSSTPQPTSRRSCKPHPPDDRHESFHHAIVFALIYLREVALSTFRLALLVLEPQIRLNPRFVEVPLDLQVNCRAFSSPA